MSTARNEPASEARPVVAHPFLLALLRSPVGGLIGGMCELQFVGRATGRRISLPVQCARDEARLVIYVGRSATKKWWRNFIDGHAVQVRIGGASHTGHGRVLDVEHPDRAAAEQLYRSRYSKTTVAPADPLVVIDLALDASG